MGDQRVRENKLILHAHQVTLDTCVVFIYVHVQMVSVPVTAIQAQPLK